MSGEKNLENLLNNMEPMIEPGEYVFCTVSESDLDKIESPLMIYREGEGPTVIIQRALAEQMGFKFGSSWGLITLMIHSALDAVGFLATITHHLAKSKISVNAVSAFYHDHLFVPYEKLDEALDLLISLADSSK
ncbi:MAG: ACT domain-containing protein [Candidatus Thorarchaeota archaeon]